MHAEKIEVNVPGTIMDYDIKPDEIEKLVNEWLVVDLFTNDRVSSGKAASLLNMSRIDFLNLLHQKHVVYLDYGEDELKSELDTIRNLQIDLSE